MLVSPMDRLVIKDPEHPLKKHDRASCSIRRNHSLATCLQRQRGKGNKVHGVALVIALFCVLVPARLFVVPAYGAEEQTIGPPAVTEQTLAPLPDRSKQILAPPPSGIQAFRPGETLTYDVSWSGLFSAGTATMTVEAENLSDGREVLRFVVQGRTQGLMDSLYPVNDTVQSVFDPRLMQSLSYSLRENFGKKKRLRVTEFDHARRTAVCRLNEEPPEVLTIPDRVQDGLSLLFLLRTKDDLLVGRRMDIEVVDSGKNWTVEVAVLAREKVTTPAGEFDTIKIRTHPKHQGVYQDKGVVQIWLTDDGRKVPVLMKSTLKVGSFVFELTDMRPATQRFLQ